MGDGVVVAVVVVSYSTRSVDHPWVQCTHEVNKNVSFALVLFFVPVETILFRSLSLCCVFLSLALSFRLSLVGHPNNKNTYFG